MKTIKENLQEINDVQNSDLDLAYYYEDGMTYDEYYNAVTESIYDKEIIYYSVAIKYLAENDASLSDSLEIASELGYTVENLNSEVLATLLYQRELHEEFWSYCEDIEEYFNELENK